MTDEAHSIQVEADGIHILPGLGPYADETARNAAVIGAADVKKGAWQDDTGEFYIARTAGSGADKWLRADVGIPGDAAGIDVDVAASEINFWTSSVLAATIESDGDFVVHDGTLTVAASGSPAASAGRVRLPANSGINLRNNADTGNVAIFAGAPTDAIVFGGGDSRVTLDAPNSTARVLTGGTGALFIDSNQQLVIGTGVVAARPVDVTKDSGAFYEAAVRVIHNTERTGFALASSSGLYTNPFNNSTVQAFTTGDPTDPDAFGVITGWYADTGGLSIIGMQTDATSATGGPALFLSGNSSDAGTEYECVLIDMAKESGGNPAAFAAGEKAFGIAENTTTHFSMWGGGNFIIGAPSTQPNYKFHVVGDVGWAPGSSVSTTANGELTFEFTDNNTITVKARGTDGTERSGTIALT